MAVHAYDERFVDSAQVVLGDAVDYAVNGLGIDADTFGGAFAGSEISKQFANGDPAYVAGMDGCELAKAVMDAARLSYPEQPERLPLEKNAEFWAGWALARYQWETGFSFTEILNAIPLKELIRMYPIYCDADIFHFSDRIRDKLHRACPVTRLEEHRRSCGYSQAELSDSAGISLQELRSLEQRKLDINEASAATLYQLSKALFCKIEDLIELETV